MDYTKLYLEAQKITTTAIYDAELEIQHQYELLAEQALDGIDALKTKILLDVENVVLEAAKKGKRSNDLLTFKGSDIDDKSGLCILFLVRGPKDLELRKFLKSRGVVFLIDALSEALAPFYIGHRWNTHDHTNVLTITW
jgi:hypothetical protein